MEKVSETRLISITERRWVRGDAVTEKRLVEGNNSAEVASKVWA